MRNSPCKKVCLSLEYRSKFYFMLDSNLTFDHLQSERQFCANINLNKTAATAVQRSHLPQKTQDGLEFQSAKPGVGSAAVLQG